MAEVEPVSVPLRGKYRGELSNKEFFNNLEASISFPSPCGVNIVANQVHSSNWKLLKLLLVSVPLRGKYRGE